MANEGPNMDVTEGRPLLERVIVNLNFTLTFVLAAFIEVSLLLAAFYVGASLEEKIVSVATLFFGFSLGSIIGTAASPYDSKEDTKFAAYWKALVLFASGYLASKLDGTVSAALSAETYRNLAALTSFRALGFCATLLLTAKVTFACRSYHSPGTLLERDTRSLPPLR